MISGSTGSPNRRIISPSRPNTSSSARSSGCTLTANAPSVAKNRMPAYRYGRGVRSSLAHSGASGRLSTSSRRLPMNRLAISVQISSGSFSNSVGPGWIP